MRAERESRFMFPSTDSRVERWISYEFSLIFLIPRSISCDRASPPAAGAAVATCALGGGCAAWASRRSRYSALPPLSRKTRVSWISVMVALWTLPPTPKGATDLSSVSRTTATDHLNPVGGGEYMIAISISGRDVFCGVGSTVSVPGGGSTGMMGGQVEQKTLRLRISM